ncbi:MAG TPA: hypothetical protein VH478_20595 [Trebonia sp.]|jgi:hypothetical protein|nr:hypothetical protein [Trebonia sp.]
MTIGASLLLIAVGAILRFAVSTVSTHGINLHIIGDILMIVGIVGLVLWLLLWGPWARRRRVARQAPADVDPVAYPDRPAGGRATYRVREYRRDEYPNDEYPTAEYPPDRPVRPN